MNNIVWNLSSEKLIQTVHIEQIFQNSKYWSHYFKAVNFHILRIRLIVSRPIFIDAVVAKYKFSETASKVKSTLWGTTINQFKAIS